MTDNEIIKSLEICVNGGKCKDCYINPHRGNYGYCTSLALKEAFGLINRQKAEIEELTELAGKRFDDFASEYDSKMKSKAIKEFAENLKQDIKSHRTEMNMNGLKGTPRTDELTYATIIEYIDNLVKEMTEEK